MSEFMDFFEEHIMLLLHRKARERYPDRAVYRAARRVFIQNSLEQIAQTLVDGLEEDVS